MALLEYPVIEAVSLDFNVFFMKPCPEQRIVFPIFNMFDHDGYEVQMDIASQVVSLQPGLIEADYDFVLILKSELLLSRHICGFIGIDVYESGDYIKVIE